MPTRLIVNEENTLEEVAEQVRPMQPAALRWPAKIISVLFHPVFIPVYIIIFLIKIYPHFFAAFSEGEKKLLVVRFAIMYIMFPLVTVLLLKALGFIKSIELKTQRDRIIPYVICMIYYFWVWYVFKNQPEFTRYIVWFALAVFITSILGLITNAYFKISMHAMAMGVAITFIMLLAFTESISIGIYISAALAIAGLVLTSRFIDSDHSSKEIYGGLLAGILSQLAAYVIA